MMQDKFDEMRDRFFAGKTSPEENDLLQENGIIDEDDLLYAQAMQEESKTKMDWTFEEFLQQTDEAKVVEMQPRGSLIKKLLIAATLVGAMITAFVLFEKNKKQKEFVHINPLEKPIEKIAEQKQIPEEKIEEVEPAEIQPKKNVEIKTEKKSTPIKQKLINHKIEKTEPEYLVMVNGKPITDEKEAIEISNKSIAMLAQNLNGTIEELKPITQIKLKL